MAFTFSWQEYMYSYRMSNFFNIVVYLHVISVLWYPRKNALTPICVIEGTCFLNGFFFVYLFTYIQHDFNVRWRSRCLTVARRVWHVERELITLVSSPGFSVIRIPRSLVLCVIIFNLLFALFLLQFHCLSFVLCLLITALVTSNFS